MQEERGKECNETLFSNEEGFYWRQRRLSSRVNLQATILLEKISDLPFCQDGTAQYLLSDFDGRNHADAFLRRFEWRGEHLPFLNLQVGDTSGQFKEIFPSEKTAGTELGPVENDQHNCL